ncbi:MAG: hypothetical protein IKM30_07650 [Oscillospiraceae bacterium]|nr:hypothetical protein [Oscillospiraceae bacterium]
MKSYSRIPIAYRYFFIILSLLCTISYFILYTGRSLPASYHKGYLNYETLSLWSEESPLAPDELEPDRYAVNVPGISESKVASAKELEHSQYDKPAYLASARKGHRGIGYVTGLPRNTQSAMAVLIDVPATQHYDLTICMAANQTVTNALRINGKLYTQFTLNGNADFMRVTFYGIFLEEGWAEIAVDTIDGGLDLDYLELTGDTMVFDIDFDISEEPCTPQATPEAKALYAFLKEHWNKQILTGQYASDHTNRELALIYEITGQLPAIRFGELGTENEFKQIEAAMDWHLYTGGIVGLMWHWNAPGTNTVYAEETDFSLTNALQDADTIALATMDLAQAEALAKEQKITEELLLMLQDIDQIAHTLEKFKHMNIPILWRPLHEAGGGWYWWGADGQNAYTALWQLLYTRLTDYHGLNHLIWIWNGQSASYLVPEHTYDLASVDVYLNAEMQYGSRYEQYLALARMTNGKKMLALSECSSLPSIEMLMLDRTIWSFFGLWYGEYIMQSDGSFSDLYYSSSDLYNLYNSDRALSLNDFLSLSQ